MSCQQQYKVLPGGSAHRRNVSEIVIWLASDIIPSRKIGVILSQSHEMIRES